MRWKIQEIFFCRGSSTQSKFSVKLPLSKSSIKTSFDNLVLEDIVELKHIDFIPCVGILVINSQKSTMSNILDTNSYSKPYFYLTFGLTFFMNVSTSSLFVGDAALEILSGLFCFGKLQSNNWRKCD